MSVGMTVNDTVLAPLLSLKIKLRAQFNLFTLAYFYRSYNYDLDPVKWKEVIE